MFWLRSVIRRELDLPRRGIKPTWVIGLPLPQHVGGRSAIAVTGVISRQASAGASPQAASGLLSAAQCRQLPQPLVHLLVGHTRHGRGGHRRGMRRSRRCVARRPRTWNEDYGDDVKLLGVYSTEDEHWNVPAEPTGLPGFRDEPESGGQGRVAHRQHDLAATTSCQDRPVIAYGHN